MGAVLRQRRRQDSHTSPFGVVRRKQIAWRTAAACRTYATALISTHSDQGTAGTGFTDGRWSLCRGNRYIALARAFDLLPPLERSRRYRQMAKAALNMAEDAPTPNQKVSYLSLSVNWHSLATGLERELHEDRETATRDEYSGTDA